jgi:hypothetical protein
MIIIAFNLPTQPGQGLGARLLLSGLSLTMYALNVGLGGEGLTSRVQFRKMILPIVIYNIFYRAFNTIPL